MSDSIPASSLAQPVQAICDALWQRTRHGSARVIVGAGFSLNAKPRTPQSRRFPLWRQLAEGMAAALPAGGDVGNPLHLAQAYAQKFGAAGLRQFIEAQVPDQENLPGELHGQLVRLPWVDIFTTNYDTLLERAAEEVRDAPYAPVTAPVDIAGKFTRRLVKLHGTVGLSEPLVATLDGYSNYSDSHKPFVALVQQALAESTFLLVGFNGDDPNFVAFWAWVRRCYGEAKPAVYWCGLDLNASRRLVFESQGITPLDLDEVAGSDPTQRHATAYKWLFDRLEARPPLELNWAPRESSAQSRGFTPFSEFPRAEGMLPAKLLEVTAIWRQQRQEYPGWHLAPDEARERVASSANIWRHVIFKQAETLDPINRLLVLHEFHWRSELALTPIFTIEADRFIGWLEAVDPFAGVLGLAPALVPPEADRAAVAEAWLFLALCILRTARDDVDEPRFALWHARLTQLVSRQPAMRAELQHESVLLALHRLDLPAFRAGLAQWRTQATLPIEFAQLAAYYAEAEDGATAEVLANQAIDRLGPPTPASIWLESWCHVVLRSLHWEKDTREKQRSAEAIARAKRQGYDIWATFEAFREGMKESPRRPRVSYQARFDSGDVRRTIHLGSNDEEIPAFQLLRFLERAPVGIYAGMFSNFAEPAAHAAVWLRASAPRWALATLLRARAKPEIVDEWYDRLTVANFDQAEVEALCARLLQLVRTEIERLPDQSDGFGRRMIITGLDVLSRLALRLRAPALRELVTCYRTWYLHPSLVAWHDVATPLGDLFRRVLSAMPDEEVSTVVVALLDLPVFGERDFQPATHEQFWPEPFDWLLARETKPPPGWQCSPETWDRLLLIVGTNGTLGRRFAFARLYFLHVNRWLTAEQDDALEAALWRCLDSNSGLPSIPGFRSRLVLKMRGAKSRNAAGLLKASLLARVPNPWLKDNSIQMDQLRETSLWLESLVTIFRHEVLSSPDETTLVLEAAEAAQLAENVLRWLELVQPAIGERKESSGKMDTGDIESIVGSLAALFGEALFFRLPPDHPMLARASQALNRFRQLGYPMYRLLPGELFHHPDFAAAHALHLTRALLSEDGATVRAATSAMRRWFKGARQKLLAAMPMSLLETAAIRIGLRCEPGLDQLTRCLALTVEELGVECPEPLLARLLLALLEIADASEPSLLKHRLEVGEIDRQFVVEHLHLRSWSAYLARKLDVVFATRGEARPGILVRWQEIRDQAVLPEIRRA